MDLNAVADELYGLPPGEFTSARDARAKSARQAGDRDLAGAIKNLRRPTTSAWLTNLLVRQRREQLTELLHLGATMRQAQAELAGEELRRLSQQRQQVVSALGREIRLLARDLGQPVSESVARELEGTLHAALAEAGASDAVASGRLTSALSYSGFGSVDLAGAVALPAEPPAGGLATRAPTLPARPPAAGASPAGRPARTPAEAPAGPAARPAKERGDDPGVGGSTVENRSETARRRREAVEAAEAVVRGAQALAADAKREVAERRRRVGRAGEERERRLHQIRDLEQRLQRLHTEEERAAEQVGAAERALAEAEQSAARADAEVTEAQAALEREGR